MPAHIVLQYKHNLAFCPEPLHVSTECTYGVLARLLLLKVHKGQSAELNLQETRGLSPHALVYVIPDDGAHL